MANQVIFFEKNKADYSYDGVTATASESSDIAKYVLNRSNLNGWITTDSLDANNTTLTVDFGDLKSFTDLVLVKHNFKDYKAEWSDDEGATWQAFTPAINISGSVESSSWFQVTPVICKKVRLTIYGTQTPNTDKYLYQFIATDRIGKLNGWPVIANPLHSRNRVVSKMLSGKSHVSENVGSFSCDLSVTEWRLGADLSIVETLYRRNEGFLVWLCGGNETQFSSVREGYRLEDIFLMKCVNDYAPEWVKGQYTRGLKISMKLSEVVG